MWKLHRYCLHEALTTSVLTFLVLLYGSVLVAPSPLWTVEWRLAVALPAGLPVGLPVGLLAVAIVLLGVSSCRRSLCA